MPNFCGNCGSKLVDNSKFCSGCGAKAESTEGKRIMEQKPALDASKTTNGHAFAAVAVSIVVVTLVFAIVVLPATTASASVNLYLTNNTPNTINAAIFVDGDEYENMTLDSNYSYGILLKIKLDFGERNRDIEITVIDKISGKTISKQAFVENKQNSYVNMSFS